MTRESYICLKSWVKAARLLTQVDAVWELSTLMHHVTWKLMSHMLYSDSQVVFLLPEFESELQDYWIKLLLWKIGRITSCVIFKLEWVMSHVMLEYLIENMSHILPKRVQWLRLMLLEIAKSHESSVFKLSHKSCLQRFMTQILSLWCIIFFESCTALKYILNHMQPWGSFCVSQKKKKYSKMFC